MNLLLFLGQLGRDGSSENFCNFAWAKKIQNLSFCTMELKVRKYWMIFPLPKMGAENYHGILLLAHGNDKILKVFNKLQVKKTPCP